MSISVESKRGGVLHVVVLPILDEWEQFMGFSSYCIVLVLRQSPPKKGWCCLVCKLDFVNVHLKQASVAFGFGAHSLLFWCHLFSFWFLVQPLYW